MSIAFPLVSIDCAVLHLAIAPCLSSRPSIPSHKQYVKEEHLTTNASGKKVAEATRRITQNASENIGRIAYEVALLSKNPKLTVVHKSNVLAVTDGLFRETVRAIQNSDDRFKAVKVEEQIVDSCVYK